jgi:serine/threonine protein kinase
VKWIDNGLLRGSLGKVKARNVPQFFWNTTGIAIVVCGVVLGLEFIHQEDIVHHDVKPADLLMDDRGHCCIGDFGSSKFFEGDFHISRDGLTLPYEAPELWSGGTCANKNNVFAFSLVVYKLAVGGLEKLVNSPREIAKGIHPNLPHSTNGDVRSLIS